MNLLDPKGDARRRELSELRRAHGSLCVAFLSLHFAAEHFGKDNPEVLSQIQNAARPLAKMLPSYVEFSRSTSYRPLP